MPKAGTAARIAKGLTTSAMLSRKSWNDASASDEPSSVIETSLNVETVDASNAERRVDGRVDVVEVRDANSW